MKRVIVFEGQPHYLANLVKEIGVQKFIGFAFQHKLPINLVKSALEFAKVDPAVMAKALDFYCTNIRRTGIADFTRGMVVQETIKNLVNNRVKAIFLIDANLQLMPELVLDKKTGLFVSVNSLNMPLRAIYANKEYSVYQPICHNITNVKAAYIVELETSVSPQGWGKTQMRFYQPERINTSSSCMRQSALGLYETDINCTELTKTTYNMIMDNNTLSVMQIRIAATAFPQIIRV